jgi:hypothetical protein
MKSRLRAIALPTMIIRNAPKPVPQHSDLRRKHSVAPQQAMRKQNRRAIASGVFVEQFRTVD